MDQPQELGCDGTACVPDIDGSIPIVGGPVSRLTGTNLERCYTFKQAQTEAEFEQVHRLNHATFVVEVGQYGDTGERRLVDKFHHKNIYFIAILEGEIVGMVSAHDRPPFSIADRLSGPEVLDRLGGHPIEVRLLAIQPDSRHGLVFPGLLLAIHEHAIRNGCTHVLISGIQQRLPLYRKLGFRALGPAVSHGQAWFVPMVLDLDPLPEKLAARTTDGGPDWGRSRRPSRPRP